MFIISKYIKNYGFKNFVKIFLLELLYIVKFLDPKNLNIKKFNATGQFNTKQFYFKGKKKYNIGYFRATYYSLKFILNNLEIINNQPNHDMVLHPTILDGRTFFDFHERCIDMFSKSCSMSMNRLIYL